MHKIFLYEMQGNTAHTPQRPLGQAAIRWAIAPTLL